jgi:hypothetical protein
MQQTIPNYSASGPALVAGRSKDPPRRHEATKQNKEVCQDSGRISFACRFPGTSSIALPRVPFFVASW